MTFTIGWWALPTIITVALFVFWYFWSDESGRDYGIDAFLKFVAAVIGSLAVWLIYFIALWATA
jgi:asparagine N-glycosylation enzyme membrane subunit Stt3